MAQIEIETCRLVLLYFPEHGVSAIGCLCVKKANREAGDSVIPTTPNLPPSNELRVLLLAGHRLDEFEYLRQKRLKLDRSQGAS
jgi:hypothetical protein